MVCRDAKQHGRCSLLGLASQCQWTHLSPPLSFPSTDSDAFWDISPSQRDQLLADFTAAAITCELNLGGAGENIASLLVAPTSTSTVSPSKDKSSCLEHLPWLLNNYWRSIYSIANGKRGGENWSNFNSKPNLHLVPNCVVDRHLVAKGTLLCGRRPRSKRAKRRETEKKIKKSSFKNFGAELQQWNLEFHFKSCLETWTAIGLGTK